MKLVHQCCNHPPRIIAAINYVSLFSACTTFEYLFSILFLHEPEYRVSKGVFQVDLKIHEINFGW